MSEIKESNDDFRIEEFRIKRMIKSLQEMNGSDGGKTSMISLLITPGEQISRVTNMLIQEQGTASNVKSRVNRLSILSAISSVLQRLKNYRFTPKNGLAIYSGTCISDNKEKKITLDFEPLYPITKSLYKCDNKFHVDILQESFRDTDVYGFIIVDGHGCLFGTLKGNYKKVISKFSVELPNKQGRGGQSKVRFERNRIIKRNNYIRQVAETATKIFITNDQPNVKGLIIAGLADFKDILLESKIFDPRLVNIVLQKLIIAYGQEIGFSQAIELSKEILGDSKLLQEKKIIFSFMDEIAKNSDKYCFGIKDIITALKNGAVQTLIVWEDLPTVRYQLTSGKVVYGTSNEDKILNDNKTVYDDVKIEIKESLIDWISTNYKTFGANIHIVSNRSSEGSQFQKGFGGIGAILRYPMKFEDDEDEKENDENKESEEFFI